MSIQLGRINICCDAPPYAIVQATRLIGILTPEDVRWCRLSHYLHRSAGWRELVSRRWWQRTLASWWGREEKTCSCGQPLPKLERYTFTYVESEENTYQIGQCPRCYTVFWEEDQPAPSWTAS